MIDLHNTLKTSLLVLSLSKAVVSQANAPPIIPAADQTCASACTVFQDALSACQPDSGDQTQYTACFCQSAYLVPLKSSSGNICAPQCSDTDFANIANWYKGFCANNGATPVTTTTTTAAAVPGGTTMVTVTTTPPPAGTSTSSAPTTSTTEVEEGSSSDEDQEDYSNGSEWFHSHYQWVIMIIVLAVGFLTIGIGGSIWYRRYKRRRDYNGSPPPAGTNAAASHPEMSQWAPSQHSVHDFGAGPGAAHFRETRQDTGSPVSTIGRAYGDSSGEGSNGSGNSNRAVNNGKGKEVVGVSRVQSPAPSTGPIRAPSRRLSKTPTGSRR